MVELLGLGIRQNVNIQGIILNDQEIKTGQYADDLWTTLIADEQNLKETIKEIEDFGSFSGLKLNFEKCAILKLGPFRYSDARYFTMNKLFWSPKEIRILGVDIFPDWDTVLNANYIKLLDKVKQRLSMWINRDLTPIGKITVVNSLVCSLFSHKFLALPSPPDSFFLTFKKIITDFIWNGKTPEISYVKMIQRYE